MIQGYLKVLNPDASLVNSIADFYIELKSDFIKKLLNGNGLLPTLSLRTLCRGLKYAAKNFCNNVSISIYDGICLSFLTDLDRQSTTKLESFIQEKILNKNKNLLKNTINRNKPQISGLKTNDFIKIEGYWIPKGDNTYSDVPEDVFVFTKTVKENLRHLARVCSAQLPCLLQGDTSVGKTSLIKWLARATNNTLIRINNHDHTDLQEYVGNYVLDNNGKLVFKEGLLVQAMRKGYWILLDELNLASSEVLEALNRVLDDNREIFIPEIQETVKADPRFILFATQNPPGKYPGRKQLSRAFRNRFIELHFDDLELNELNQIVEIKCKLPPTYSSLLVKTISELQTRRSQLGIFAGKNSLITLRDLFRWAKRYSNFEDNGFSDWKQYLAEQGFIILASRCRKNDDILTIHGVIEKVFRIKIDVNNLKNPQTFCKPIMDVLNEMEQFCKKHVKSFVWTESSRRLALLTGLAYKFGDPFLLVGETGLGKTRICQILSQMNEKYLYIINCHMHSEAADFLGSIRPVRERDSKNETAKLFEWQDGPLITAIREGNDFLIDEISLADDSVLERLNSLLETERSILVSENSTNEHSDVIYAHKNFRIFSTMNPGGDFGKKELSAALRNRFLEIWCPSDNVIDEFKLIVEKTLTKSLDEITRKNIGEIICNFLNWLREQFFSHNLYVSIRDVLLWIEFINKTTNSNENKKACNTVLNPYVAITHGACLIFIDSLSYESYDLFDKREKCMDYLFDLTNKLSGIDTKHSYFHNINAIYFDKLILKFGPFTLKKIQKKESLQNQTQFNLSKYFLNSPTTSLNVMRLMRCLLMNNPIMLEGSPGVGKTTLVQALAEATNNDVVRINLSDQTDLNELFGNDLPASDSTEKTQSFKWHDGPFLVALKKGSWIILDEINLASQSVLEGLNSCLDHRAEIFITELGKSFQVNKEKTKIFACQNPYKQGGGRKGLPKSFLNRFSKVYIDQMKSEDILFILKNTYPQIKAEIIEKMVLFNETINKEVCQERKWGIKGSPWEFNLRDMFRWCDLMIKENNMDPGAYVYLIYAKRFRLGNDRNHIYNLFKNIFNSDAYQQEDTSLYLKFTNTHIQIGQSILKFSINEYTDNKAYTTTLKENLYQLNNYHAKYLEAVMKCLQMNWMVILVGKSCVGKTTLIRLLAKLCNHTLTEIAVNSATDTSDLLGCFTKAHIKGDIMKILNKLRCFYDLKLKTSLDNVIFMKDITSKIFEADKCKSKLETIDMEIFNTFQFNNEFLSIIDWIKSEVNIIANEKQKNNCTVIEIVNQILFEFNKLDLKLQKNANDMKFEWLDSDFVEAIRNGNWVLIDNANFCNPSVLDRLNPLMEPNGVLNITEKGYLNEELNYVKPHKNFRLFLCVNESFGEISRAMRNRGIEIYVDEIDPLSNDSITILQNLFSINQQKTQIIKSEFLTDFISELQRNFMPLITFEQVLNLFKLTRDYLNADKTTFKLSLVNAIRELYPEQAADIILIIEEMFRNNKYINAGAIQAIHYRDVYKLKSFPLYRYISSFPIYNMFINCLLSNNRNSLIELNKQTSYIQIWLKNIPLKYKDLIANHVFDNQRMIQSNVAELAKLYFQFFNTKLFGGFLNGLNELNILSEIDLHEEPYTLHENHYLMLYLKSIIQDGRLYDIINISNYLDLVLIIYLSEYRCLISSTQMDSLLKISEEQFISLNNKLIKSASENKLSSVKILENFFTQFFNDLKEASKIYISNNDFNFVDVRLNIHSIEKFRFVCISTFDPILTFPYLQYYWKEVEKAIKSIETILPNCWSNELRSYVECLHKYFYFDDNLYNTYYKSWDIIHKELKSSGYLINDQATAVLCKKINQDLNRFFAFEKETNLKDLIKNNLLHEELWKYKLNASAFFKHASFNYLAEFLESIEKKVTEQPQESLVLLFNKYRMIPLNNLFNLMSLQQDMLAKESLNVSSTITPINLTELLLNNLKLGKTSSILRLTLNSYQYCFLDYRELLNSSSLENNMQQIDNEVQDNMNLKLSCLHYNWLHGYFSKMLYPNNENDSLGTKLEFYDEDIDKFDQLIGFILSNCNFISNSYEIVDKYDKNIKDLIHREIQIICNELFGKNEDAFYKYLFEREFNSGFLNYIKTDQSEDNIAKTLVAFGCIMIYAFAPMKPMDPIMHNNLIVSHLNETMEIIENELNCYLELNKEKCGEALNQSQFYLLHRNYLSKMKSEQINNNKIMSYRENYSDYYNIVNEFSNAIKQFCSFNQLEKIMKGLQQYKNKSYYKEYQTWMVSLESFMEKSMNKFALFSDILYLPLSGLACIGYGMSILYTKWVLKFQEKSKSMCSIVSLIRLLFGYPYKSYLQTAIQLQKYYEELESNESLLENSELLDRLQILSLLHIYNSFENECVDDEKNNESRYEIFLKICYHFNTRYRKEIELNRENEETSGYQYKVYGQSKLNAELEEEEYQNTFPSFLNEFQEFKTDNSVFNLNGEKKNELKKEANTHINNQILSQFFKLITLITNKYFFALKFNMINNNDNEYKINDFESINHKTISLSYKLAAGLLQKYSVNLSNEDNNYISHLLFASLIKQHGTCFDEEIRGFKNLYNIYKDSNKTEVLRCKKALNCVKERLQYLLTEWPDNPILIELLKICKRIESFYINDTIVKYLTGLELLMHKAQNWQSIASKASNLDQELKEISSIIIDWRKLELDCWKQSLELEEEANQIKCVKTWFFHVFSVCIEYLHSSQPDQLNYKEIFSTFKTFIESSTIGEYSSRLEIIKICFIICSNNINDNNKKVLNILWNIYKYYSFFTPLISDKISKFKKKIEKELNDFIKICRWQDMNYWALMQSTAKSHKTIFKLIKTFKENCSENVVDLLVAQHFSNSISIDTKLNLLNDFKDFKFKDENVTKYYSKFTQLMNKLIRSKELTNLNESFNSYAARVSQMYKNFKAELHSLYSKDKTTEKRKEDFKSLDLMRRKFLNDLLKELNYVGLSYRRGNIEYSKEIGEFDQLIEFEPINFFEINDWNAYEAEYYQCISQYLKFNSNTAKSQKTLRAIDLEKMNGFLAHLMYIIREQKKNLHLFGMKMRNFSFLNEIITAISESFSGSKFNSEIFNKLNGFIIDSRNVISQTDIILNLLSNNNKNDVTHFQDAETIAKNFESLKTTSNNIFQTLKDNSKIIKNKYFFCSSNDDRENLLNIQQINTCFYNESFEKYVSQLKSSIIPELKDSLKGVSKYDKNIDFVKIFKNIFVNIENMEECFNQNKHHVESENSENVFDFKLIKKFFKTIEVLSKKTLMKGKNNGEEDEFGFQENSVYIEFYENFIHGFKNLNLDDLNMSLVGLIKDIESKLTENKLIQCATIFSDMVIITQNYYKFLKSWFLHSAQHHFNSCKFLNSLLETFIDLKHAGFELQDLQDDNKDGGNTIDKTEETCGLGEGEGKKDVSDEIETEDQLEGTKEKEEKEKQEESKTKEEDNGIEMSDNFEGELEDKKLEDGSDDEDKDDQKEELEDELGNIDEEQDVLDEKFWDGKDEPNEEENNTSEENNKNGNLKNEESELGAKDDDLPVGKEQDKADPENKSDNDEPNASDNEDIESQNPNEADEKEVDDENMNEKTEEEKRGENDDIENVADDFNIEPDEIKDEETNGGENEEEEEEGEEPIEQDNNDDDDDITEKPTPDLNKTSNNKTQNQPDYKNDLKNNATSEQSYNENGAQENDEITDDNPSTDLKNLTKTGLKKSEFLCEEENLIEMQNENMRNRNDEKNDNRTLGDNENEEITEGDLIDMAEVDTANDSNKRKPNQQFRHLKNQEENYDAEMRDIASQDQKQKELNKEQEAKNLKTKKSASVENCTEKMENEQNFPKIQNEIDTQENDIKTEPESKITEISDNKENLDTNDYQSLFNKTIGDHFDTIETRNYLETELSTLRDKQKESQIISKESIDLWHKYEIITQQYSKELCEQIRLILEPTKCSKLKGDYKTGKRLNMRRVMEYIATECRKDKIWLRRTKPSKRDYKLLLAIDNSSSMNDNHCMQLAYETIATLVNAFNYLQVGSFGLVSFGENVSVLQPLQEHFNQDIGAQIFDKINFSDNKTKIAELLKQSMKLFNDYTNDSSSSNPMSKLLIILSDGRGVFYEGIDQVKSTVQKCIQEGIFIVFIILDMPGKSSIFDIKMPMFTENSAVPKIVSYMESFPFPFYIVLRDINSLTIVMIEALKQWFDLVSRLT